MWVFDQSDGSARLLRSRCGHSAPPTKIRFASTGGDAVKILSGGILILTFADQCLGWELMFMFMTMHV